MFVLIFYFVKTDSSRHDIQTWYHVHSHYSDIIMSAMASLINGVSIVYSTVFVEVDQRKYRISAWLASVWGIHRWPVNSPHKGPVTRKMFPFDDVIMWRCCFVLERPIWQEQSLKGLGQWCRVCIRNSLHVYYIRILLLLTPCYRFRRYGHPIPPRIVNTIKTVSLQWRHNERVGVSNHQPRDCLLYCLCKAQIKENIKAPRHWPLRGEFTGDRWIPRTKGQ